MGRGSARTSTRSSAGTAARACARSISDGDVTAGIEDLLVLKTTDSGWEGYLHEQYTTLPETDDRILCTIVTASWDYAGRARGLRRRLGRRRAARSSTPSATTTARRCSSRCSARRGGSGGGPGDRPRPLRAAQPAPPAVRPLALRDRERPRDLPRHDRAVRAHRGHRRALPGGAEFQREGSVDRLDWPHGRRPQSTSVTELALAAKAAARQLATLDSAAQGSRPCSRSRTPWRRASPRSSRPTRSISRPGARPGSRRRLMDRLTLDARAASAGSPTARATIAALPDPGRRGRRRRAAAQRPRGAQGSSPAGRDRRRLRGAPERDDRRRRAVPEVGQRGAAARFVLGAAHSNAVLARIAAEAASALPDGAARRSSPAGARRSPSSHSSKGSST